MICFTVAEMIAAERAADAAGHSYAAMMEQAGRATAEALTARLPIAGKRVLVLVGPGNNGGDGLVAARYLAAAGADLFVYLAKPRDPAVDLNLAQVQQMGLPVATAADDTRYRVLRARLRISDVLVDALLGTGVSRPIGGELAALLRQTAAGLAERNAALRGPAPTLTSLLPTPRPAPPRVRVLAVDCPSGLNCDTGELDPLALPADWTVTFAGPKRGHFAFPGAAACGELIVADIGIAPAPGDEPRVEVATPALAAALLPDRPADGHKGTFGTALIVAGTADYWGAPALAGRGAYRAGCGLTALAVPNALRTALAPQLPEATFPHLPDALHWSAAGAQALRPWLARCRALLVGPGLGAADAFLDELLATPDLPPLVLDADALNYLARRDRWWERLPPQTILTPHPGEMARLTGAGDQFPLHPPFEAQPRDRIALAQRCAAQWQVHLVLKGAHTVIARPDGSATIAPIAAPLLATAGSGDVLAGIIVGLLAQGVSPADAALLGAYLHAAAGRLLAAEYGNAGLLAHEIADAAARVRAALADGR